MSTKFPTVKCDPWTQQLKSQALFVISYILRGQWLPWIVGKPALCVCVWGGSRTCRANKILPSCVQQHLAGGKKCNCPLQWIIGIYVEKQTWPWLGGFVCPNSGNAVFPCGASVWNVRPCTCIPTGGNLRCRVFFKAPDSSPRPTMTLHIERPRCLTLSPRLFTLPKP